MQPYVKLNDGNSIPAMGYGVFCIPQDECAACVEKALKTGYRHIDTAQIYRNERGVGEALQKTEISRKDIFLTSKVWCSEFGKDKTAISVKKSLKRLKTDYVDLMLLHRPYGDYLSAWKDLEKCVAEGMVKSVGISNFNKKQTQRILDICKIKPAVNQIECHPYASQIQLKAYLGERGILTEAWYPLGHGNKELMSEEVILSLAEKYSKTPAQIILRWHLQSGNIVIPKTVKEQRMTENFNTLFFELSEEDVCLIDRLNKNKILFTQPDWVQRLNNKLFPQKID